MLFDERGSVADFEVKSLTKSTPSINPILATQIVTDDDKLKWKTLSNCKQVTEAMMTIKAQEQHRVRVQVVGM